MERLEGGCRKAVKDGVIAEQKIITGNDDPAQQITQLQNLVLEGYDAIVIDAASPTALNGGIKEACDAGIVVVVYDFLATEPCAIKLNVDYHDYGVQETELHGRRCSAGRAISWRSAASPGPRWISTSPPASTRR